jgi:tetratricopeptide (TPR) repeat protein/TolB-like protein
VLALFVAVPALLLSFSAVAQSTALVAPASAASSGSAAVRPEATAGGRILLVLPFDNRSGQPSLEWIREAAAEILESRFSAAGFAPMSRADRLYALDHLGLPQGFQPSRASSLRLAQTLDADSIVVGSFRTEGGDLIVEAQLVDVPRLRMTGVLSTRGPLRQMADVFDHLAWMLTRQLDPASGMAEETFIAAGRSLRLDAFEQYIRGITEPDQQERLRHLQQAVQLSPAFSPAWMALGREDFGGQNYSDAAAAFAHVGSNDADALEAGFYRGISLLFSGDYPHAEASFAQVAHTLPLAEVLNNQAVAQSRQEKDATALFRQAVASDPNRADYHFNLAVSLHRHGNPAEAQSELAQCLRLRPADDEVRDLQDFWKKPAPAGAVASQTEPLERIVRTFDAAAFRQAAQLMQQMEATRLAALSPHEQALRLAARGSDALDRGLVLEAERLFQAALAQDGNAAVVHAGLAEVREQSGDAASARKEAGLSLQLLPSPQAYLVLARLDLVSGHLEEAGREVDAALAIEAGNKTALQLKHRIEAKDGPKP